MFTGSILIKQMMLQPMALLQPIPWSHWNWWYRKIFLPWKISIKLNKNRLSNIEVIWPCIGMTKKFFWVKNLNECFDQPSNNKTYTQLSHIFCIRKKKKNKTLVDYFQWLFPIGGLIEIAVSSLVSSVS